MKKMKINQQKLLQIDYVRNLLDYIKACQKPCKKIKIWKVKSESRSGSTYHFVIIPLSMKTSLTISNRILLKTKYCYYYNIIYDEDYWATKLSSTLFQGFQIGNETEDMKIDVRGLVDKMYQQPCD